MHSASLIFKTLGGSTHLRPDLHPGVPARRGRLGEGAQSPRTLGPVYGGSMAPAGKTVLLKASVAERSLVFQGEPGAGGVFTPFLYFFSSFWFQHVDCVEFPCSSAFL